MSGPRIADHPLRQCWQKLEEEVAQPSYEGFVQRMAVADTPTKARSVMVESLKTLQAGYSRTIRSAACHRVDFSDIEKIVTTLNKTISADTFDYVRRLEGFGELFSNTLADQAMGISPTAFHIYEQPVIEAKQGETTLFQIAGEVSSLWYLLGLSQGLATSMLYLFCLEGKAATDSVIAVAVPFPFDTQIEIPYPSELEKFY